MPLNFQKGFEIVSAIHIFILSMILIVGFGIFVVLIGFWHEAGSQVSNLDLLFIVFTEFFKIIILPAAVFGILAWGLLKRKAWSKWITIILHVGIGLFIFYSFFQYPYWIRKIAPILEIIFTPLISISLIILSLVVIILLLLDKNAD
jgi:hypothetical protein